TIALLFGGFIAEFTAILSWSKTRNSSWMMIIVGTLLLYIAQLYQILVDLNILNENLGSLWGIALLSLGLKLLPYIFYTLGFIIFLVKKRLLG
ncbi:MAG: hypothetical protein PF447_03130, partial [Spirochaetaceae bacterium]|nr:hypothetical protein [Spirochaetaceae bacterium]